MTAANEQIAADHHMRVDAVSSKLKKVGFWGAEPVQMDALSDPRDDRRVGDLKLSDGSYLVSGKTVTGFSNTEEDFSDSFVGQKVMPFRVEDTLKERGANYVQGGLFKAFVVRDGSLITGQQQYSGRKVAQALIEGLGI
jgi:putative intracellular protease/amidase